MVQVDRNQVVRTGVEDTQGLGVGSDIHLQVAGSLAGDSLVEGTPVEGNRAVVVGNFVGGSGVVVLVVGSVWVGTEVDREIHRLAAQALAAYHDARFLPHSVVDLDQRQGLAGQVVGSWEVEQVVVAVAVVVVDGTLDEQQTLVEVEVVDNLHGVQGRELGFLQVP